MASQPWVPGPAHIAVGTGTLNALEYLGKADENGADFSPAGSFDPVHTSVSGGRTPEDMQWMGENAIVRFTLSVWQASVFEKVKARRMGGTAGAGAANEIGALMVYEGLAFPLLVRSPYQVKTPYAGMQPGYRLFHAILMDAIQIPLSVKVQRPRLSFYCIPDWASNGSYALYDHDMTGFPAIV